MELDHVISGHQAAVDVVSFAIDDKMYGQDVGAAVRLKDGETMSAKDLQKWTREKVVPHKIPKKAGSPTFFFYLFLLFLLYGSRSLSEAPPNTISLVPC